MAEKTPEELRAIDAMVAEKVMGWYWLEFDSPDYDHVAHRVRVLVPPEWTQLTVCHHLPARGNVDPLCYVRDYYTRDIAADYSVLVRVRETWDIYQRQRFGLALLKSFEDRLWDDTRGHSVHEACAQYQPGDYSLAALSALGEKP